MRTTFIMSLVIVMIAGVAQAQDLSELPPELIDYCERNNRSAAQCQNIWLDDQLEQAQSRLAELEQAQTERVIEEPVQAIEPEPVEQPEPVQAPVPQEQTFRVAIDGDRAVRSRNRDQGVHYASHRPVAVVSQEPVYWVSKGIPVTATKRTCTALRNSPDGQAIQVYGVPILPGGTFYLNRRLPAGYRGPKFEQVQIWVEVGRIVGGEFYPEYAVSTEATFDRPLTSPSPISDHDY